MSTDYEAPRMHSWQVTLSFAGTNHDAAARDAEEMMERAGLGDILWSSWGFPPTYFPRSFSMYPGPPIIAGTIARSVTPRLQLALALGVSDLGETEGHHEGGIGFPEDWSDDWHLTVGAKSTSVALLVRRGGMIRLGGGPSFHWIEHWWQGTTEPGTRHAARLGLAFEAGASGPARTRLYGEALIRYHWAGSLRRGPFELQSTQGTMTVPQTPLRLDHWVATFGLGVRL